MIEGTTGLRRGRLGQALMGMGFAGLPLLANGAIAPSANGGDTAWVLTATALVLFMTIPGLSLFYGGLVRTKNVLSVLMQCFALTCLVSLLWLIVGYSLAFDSGNDFVGGFGKVLFAGVGQESLTGSIPESAFALFQMTFASSRRR